MTTEDQIESGFEAWTDRSHALFVEALLRGLEANRKDGKKPLGLEFANEVFKFMRSAYVGGFVYAMETACDMLDVDEPATFDAARGVARRSAAAARASLPKLPLIVRFGKLSFWWGLAVGVLVATAVMWIRGAV